MITGYGGNKVSKAARRRMMVSNVGVPVDQYISEFQGSKDDLLMVANNARAAAASALASGLDRPNCIPLRDVKRTYGYWDTVVGRLGKLLARRK